MSRKTIISESSPNLNHDEPCCLASIECIILIAMGLEDAYEKALQDMAHLNPRTAAAKSGVRFDNNRFTIPLLNRTFTITHPDLNVAEAGSDTPPPKLVAVLLMHYLLHADGTAVSGMWNTYRQLPGAHLFEQRFTNLVSRPMLQMFGNDAEGFNRAALAIGGKPMDRTGDAAFRLLALPKIPIGCILYLGDSEVSPSINILFDEAAPHYLPTEDLTILGSLLNSALKSYKSIKTERK